MGGEGGGAWRQAVLALWSVPGLGPKTLGQIAQSTKGQLGDLLSLPVERWLFDLPHIPAPARRRLSQLGSLEKVAESVRSRMAQSGIEVAFEDDPAYPPRLKELVDRPPLLFVLGGAKAPWRPRRRLAMVGSRHPDPGFLPFARKFAQKVAGLGIGVVSGAAAGVDRACHLGCLDAGGETWAFVGSGLDELDPAQAKLAKPILDGGGVVFSELPPGVRATPQSFPRRNRLISGAADALLVLRAGLGSGSLHTAKAAMAQGRPVLALPGDLTNPAATGCNELLHSKSASICLGVGEVAKAIGLPAGALRAQDDRSPFDWERVSKAAQSAYKALGSQVMAYDDLLLECSLPSAALTAALSELELFGLIVQRPGKIYERI